MKLPCSAPLGISKLACRAAYSPTGQWGCTELQEKTLLLIQGAGKGTRVPRVCGASLVPVFLFASLTPGQSHGGRRDRSSKGPKGAYTSERRLPLQEGSCVQPKRRRQNCFFYPSILPIGPQYTHSHGNAWYSKLAAFWLERRKRASQESKDGGIQENDLKAVYEILGLHPDLCLQGWSQPMLRCWEMNTQPAVQTVQWQLGGTRVGCISVTLQRLRGFNWHQNKSTQKAGWSCGINLTRLSIR